MSKRTRALNDILGESEKEIEMEIYKEEKRKKDNSFHFDMTPRELYEMLGKSVIGQEDAKQKLACAVCYHYTNIANPIDDKKFTYKNNVLLIGPTGCGKTYLIQKIAKAVNVPLIISDATRFSATGYVGANVESLVQDLVSKADFDLNLASKGIIYLDEIDKIAAIDGSGRDVSGRDVQAGLLKIIEGGSEIKVALPGGERYVKTDDILFIGGGTFSELYKSLRNASKADSRKNKEMDDGEQLYSADIPPLLGALQKYGMTPELLGRLPVLARLRSLTQLELRKILTDSDESVILKYARDFAAYGIDAVFDESAYDSIAERAYHRNMGARGLGAVVEESLNPLKFHLPGTNITEIKITAETINDPLKSTLDIIKQNKQKSGGTN